MEWKKVERNVWTYEKEGDEIVGKLVELEPSHFNDASNYIMDVEGQRTVVYGKTALNSKMSGLKMGSVVRIVFLGEKKSPETKRSYHDFDVFVGDDGSVPEEDTVQ